MTSVPLTRDEQLPADWRDLLALTKPRVMSLVVFTGLCGLLAAPGPVHPVLGFTAVLCIALGAGAAGALNQWYEADLDAKMKRTAKRPLPAGRMSRQTALHFGVGLAVFSVILMDLAANHLAAAVLAISILFYVLVYTVWLKRRTAQNIVIGGAAGAFPPLIGWAAVTGDVTTLPMIAAAIAPWALGLAGWIYGAVSILLNVIFMGLAIAVARNRATEPAEMKAEKKLFGFSILYLFALFAAIVADRLVLS